MQRLLVIDDEPSICQIVCQVLRERFDAEVEYALRAPEGANRLQAVHFDFALIDVLLMDGSGIDVALIAASENTPVLMTSGHPEMQRKLQQFGFPYLRKPFSLAALSILASQIMAEAADNIRQIQAATAGLRVKLDALNTAMARSRRLLAASRALTQTSAYRTVSVAISGRLLDCLHD
jgi:DNA-binding NtrC family response regulator